jgi:hypothetical protein
VTWLGLGSVLDMKIAMATYMSSHINQLRSLTKNPWVPEEQPWAHPFTDWPSRNLLHV